jgi:hypothetical protein
MPRSIVIGIFVGCILIPVIGLCFVLFEYGKTSGLIEGVHYSEVRK